MSADQSYSPSRDCSVDRALEQDAEDITALRTRVENLESQVGALIELSRRRQ